MRLKFLLPIFLLLLPGNFLYAKALTIPAVKSDLASLILVNKGNAALAPIATTQAATSITTTGAILNGIVNDNGNTTTVSIEYGTAADLSGSASVTLSTGINPIATGTGDVSFTSVLAGLNQGTTYYFRINGVNNTGTTHGSILSFTTLVPAPVISSFTPAAAGSGTAISIIGTNLSGTTAVTIGGITAIFNIVSSTNVTAIIPSGAVSGSVTLTNPAGTATLTGFTILLPPNISYTGPRVYTTGIAITPLTPTNTAGAVPANAYGQVSTFAGSGYYGSYNGTGVSASFNHPYASAVDASGNIYVADCYNHVIRKITSAGVVSTFAGSGYSGFANGTGTSANFYYPGGITVDVSGNVYVGDQGNNLIRKITPAGVVTTYAGNGSQGSANGSASSASFSSPAGLAFDGAGNLYVADRNNYMIRKITPAGVVSTLAGSGYAGSANGTGTAASFSGCTGVASDQAGNVYVVEGINNLIRKITPAGIVTTLAGSGIAGSANGVGTAASFNGAFGLAVDVMGNVYVADQFNNLIRKITPAGVVSTVAGNLGSGAVDGLGVAASFYWPVGIVLDNSGNAYITDIGNNKIRKIVLTGYSINPALPEGLSFDGTTGIINGSPTAVSSATSYSISGFNSNGSNTATVTISTVIPAIAPTISSFTPAAAGSGSVVIITGTNFLGVTGVTIGGVAATSFNVISPTNIKAIVSASAATGNIIVTNAYGNSTLAGFTFIAPPNISYAGPQSYTTGTLITPLTPANSGGAIPATAYGQVSTFVGGTAPGSNNGTGTAASFSFLSSSIVDAYGNLYVADQGNNLIRKVTPAGVVSTFAGNGSQGSSDGTGTGASFSQPRAIAIDGAGNLYVAEYNGYKVRKITPAGVVTTLAGSGSYGSNNGTGTAASFSYLSGITVDPAGNVYVSDQNSIRKITPAGVVSTFAGNYYSGSNNGTGTAASFYSPAGLACDGVGNLYVADQFNNMIRKISTAGVVTTFAGSGSQGSNNGAAGVASFYSPSGVAVDVTGNVYVVDQRNYLIRLITPGGIVSTFAGNGYNNSVNGTGISSSFNVPTGVAIDVLGNLYVMEGAKIRDVSLTGYNINPVLPAGLSFDGTTGIISGTPTAISAATNYTINAYSNSGNSAATVSISTVIPAIAPTIISFTPASASSGAAIIITGTNFLGATGVTIGGIAPTLYNVISPTSITAIVAPTSASGNITVTNSYGTSTLAGFTFLPPPNISYSTPQSYTTGVSISPLVPTNSGGPVPASIYGQVTTFVGSGSQGSNNGTGAAASFYYPQSSVFDASGNMYIADRNNNLIRKITPAGVVSTFAGSGGYGSFADGIGTLASFNAPRGLAIDGAGNIYVSDSYNNKIRKITPAGAVSTLAGNGYSGSSNGVGIAATFNYPSGIVADAAGNIYVSEQNSNLIRKITPAGVVSTFAGSGSYGANNGTGTAASFNNPAGLALDGTGNLYVADQNNNLIRKITPGGTVTTLAGSGSSGSANGTGAAASFSSPAGLTVDASGNIYVADQNNNQIRLITPGGVVTTIAGNSSSGSNNSVGITATFNSPAGVSLDGQGNLYVIDQNNNLIRKVAVTGYTISPVLPVGLSFDATTGIITGAPSVATLATTYTVNAYSTSGSNAATVSIATVIPAVAPTITSFSPASVVTGAPITITGTNLLGATAVSIGGVAATSYTVVSPTSIIAVVASGSTTGSVAVTNPYGTATLTGFSLLPPPNIAYTSPQSYTTGAAITPLVPTNSGGAVPANVYLQVSTFAGSGAYGSTNGTGTAASFNTIKSVAVDALGNVYVADQGNNVIRKITPGGVVSTFAGSGSQGYADGAGTVAKFNQPRGVAVDIAGNVYVTDCNNQLIRKITPAGVVSTIAGSGNYGYTNGTGIAASFSYPSGIAVDVAGNVYVSDQGYGLIRKITSGGTVTTLAGSGNYGSANGLGTAAGFYYPAGLAVDASGNVYVADQYNHMIRKITPAGLVTTLAGNSYSGSFYYPSGVAVDASGNVYVADQNNNQIKMITSAGVVTTLAGSASSGSANGTGITATFNAPAGIALDASGNLFVADQNNYLIRQIALTGYTISPTLPSGLSFDGTTGTISGTPSAVSASTTYTVKGYSTSGNSTTTVNIAAAIPAVAPTIASFTPASAIVGASITVTGTNLLGATGVTIGGAPALSFNVLSPNSLTAVVGAGAASGSITVTNPTGTGTLSGFTFIPPPIISYATPQIYNTGTAITALVPTNTGSVVPATAYGQVSAFAGTGNVGTTNGSASGASFYSPTSAVFDATGNTYVADATNNLIRKITPAGIVSTFAGSGSGSFADGTGVSANFNYPAGLAIDASNNIYVADHYNKRIRKITPAGVVTTFAGSGSYGSNNGAATSASFSSPSGLAIDASGNVFVADQYNSLIRKITPAGVVTTFAGTGYSSSYNGTGTSAAFNYPSGLAIDGVGNLYVADTYNHMIRKITPAAVVTTLAGNGSQGSANGNGAAASFNYPAGLAVDGAGNVYVADQYNNQIRMITPTGNVSTLAGNTTSGSANGIGTAASFNSPTGVVLDGAGNLYVCDQANNLIRKISLTGYAINPALPAGLNFASTTGTISGTPTAVSIPTDYTVNVIGSTGTGTATLNIAVGTPSALPTAASFSPASATTGNTITITGTNFTNVTAVKIGGVAASSFKITSPTVITAVVGAAASGSVVVTNQYGAATVTGFTYLIPPAISYTGPQTYTTGVAITALSPSTTGSTIPNSLWGQVSTYAGSGTVGSTNGTLLAAGFNQPISTAIDASGNMYVAELGNNLIRKITPAGSVSTLAGSGAASSVNGTGTSASFNHPSGIAVDGSGNVYVIEQNVNLVRKITPAGVVTTLAGNGYYGSTNGLGTNASFGSLAGITVDNSGNIYVSEWSNNMIRKITPAGMVTTLAGSGYSGAVNGIGTFASFSGPASLTVDGSGIVYVADMLNNRIRKVMPDGTVSTLAGSGAYGSANGIGTLASFSYPSSITIDNAGNIYVADGSIIRKITLAGVVTTMPSNTGQSFYLTGLSVDAVGSLYASVPGKSTINQISTTGYSINPALPKGLSIDGTGAISGTATVASPATNYTVSANNSVGIGTANINIAVIIPAIAPTVTSFSPANATAGTSVTITGNYFTGATAISFGGVPATSFTVVSPTTLTAIVGAAASGNVSVTNPYGTTTLAGFTFIPAPSLSYVGPNVYISGIPITPLSPSNSGGAIASVNAGQVSTFAGNGIHSSVSGTLATAGFKSPVGTAIDGTGNMYVVDEDDNLIRKITPAGIVTTFAGNGSSGFADGVGTSASFNYPQGLAVDGTGNVYVADQDNNRIRKITPAGIVSTFAGNSIGASDGTGTAASFSYPSAIAIDASGNLFVADAGNNRIRKITPAGVVSTFAGSGLQGSVNGTGTAASFNFPSGIALDASGNLYVADQRNLLIRKITPAGVVSTLAGSGTSGNLDGAGTSASFYNPTNLAIDGSGNVYMTDEFSNRIRMITPTGMVSTLAGSDTAGVTNGVGKTTKFSLPTGITYDGQGNLYIADEGNGMIRKIVIAGYAITPALPAGLAFDGNTGIISGTPAAIAAATNYTVRGSNGSGTSTATVNIAVVNQGTTTQTITFTPPGPVPYGSADFAPGATASSNLAVNYTSADTTVATISNGKIHIKRAGNTIITATQLGDGTYAIAAAVKNTVTISPAALTITANNQSKVYGATNPALTSIYSGFVNGDDTTKLVSKGVISTTATNVSSAGTYPITITGATSPNYTISYIAGSLNITPATLAITPNNQTRLYGAANPAFTASYVGFVNNDDATKLTAQPVITTIATLASIVGSYPVTASGATSPNYTISYVTGSLNITPATLTIIPNNQIRVYGAANPAFTAGYVGFVNNDDATKLTAQPVITTTATLASAVGSYPVTASAAASPNYTISYVAGSLNITPATLTITPDNQTKVYGAANPAFTAGYVGFVNNDDATKLTAQPVMTTTATLASAVGSYPVAAGGATSPNYIISYVAGSLNVTSAVLTITANNLNKFYSDINPPLTINYSGFVNGDTQASLNTQPIVTTSASTSSPVGVYPITVIGATLPNYTLNYAAGTLTVNAAPAPTITAIGPSTAIAGITVTITGTYFLDATSISFGGVPASSFTVVSPNSITAVVGTGASGNVTVITPSGTGTFAGFGFVPVPLITAGGPTTFIKGGNVILTANPGTGYNYQWVKDGVNISGATGSTYTATQGGAYTVIIALNSVSLVSIATVVNAVFSLPPTNFKLTANSATCKGSANGLLNITAQQHLNYTATISGNGINTQYPFTDSLQINSLTAGSYNVCITVAGQLNFQQCFTAVVTEPKDLSVYVATVKSGNQVVLTLGGGAVYNVNLNGSTFMTANSQITLTLAKGNNSIIVSTDKVCQGVFSDEINISSDMLVYPNPVNNILNLSLGKENIQTAVITVYSTDGRPVYTTKYTNASGVVQLDLSGLKSGLYLLKLSADHKDTIFKIIKI